MIEVMQAYVEGKTIERAIRGRGDWCEMVEPDWDWIDFDYRSKPGKKYRPYENTDEMIEDWKERFGAKDWPSHSMPLIWVACGEAKKFIHGYAERTVDMDENVYEMGELLSDFTYLDGSPCGKEVEE